MGAMSGLPPKKRGRPLGVKNKPKNGETTPSKQKDHLKPAWSPGQSGNPNGRPKGSRHKLSGDYILGVQEVFDEVGIVAIRTIASESPLEFLKLVSAIVPKQFGIEEGTQNAFFAAWQAISEGRAA